MKPRVWLIALALALSGLAGWSVLGQKQRPAAGGWEYKVVYVPGVRNLTETTLNDLGAEGWELVTFQPFNREGITIGAGNYYFKRARTAAARTP